MADGNGRRAPGPASATRAARRAKAMTTPERLALGACERQAADHAARTVGRAPSTMPRQAVPPLDVAHRERRRPAGPGASRGVMPGAFEISLPHCPPSSVCCGTSRRAFSGGTGLRILGGYARRYRGHSVDIEDFRTLTLALHCGFSFEHLRSSRPRDPGQCARSRTRTR